MAVVRAGRASDGIPQLVAKRLAAAVVIVVVLTGVVFALQKISPLDPVHAMLGPGASRSAVARQRHAMGLDAPLVNQFWDYLKGLFTGDLGTSFRTRRPVSEDLATFVPATVELAGFALLLVVVLALVLAFSSSLRWPGAGAVRFLLLVGASTPAFLLALAAILLFYRQLGWLPASGRTSLVDVPDGPTGLLTVDGLLHGRFDLVLDALEHLLLPALAVAFGPAVAVGRVLRSSLLGEERADYTRTARAKGLTEPVILRRHVLRNAIGPALSMSGLQLGLMFAGVLVIEQIFAWPGVGQYTAQSIPVADFPAIAGVTLLLGVGYVVINTVVDILQAIADPRIAA
jgi:peptide/nickel transport system permease protein